MFPYKSNAWVMQAVLLIETHWLMFIYFVSCLEFPSSPCVCFFNLLCTIRPETSATLTPEH